MRAFCDRESIAHGVWDGKWGYFSSEPQTNPPEHQANRQC